MQRQKQRVLHFRVEADEGMGTKRFTLQRKKKVETDERSGRVRYVSRERGGGTEGQRDAQRQRQNVVRFKGEEVEIQMGRGGGARGNT